MTALVATDYGVMTKSGIAIGRSRRPRSASGPNNLSDPIRAAMLCPWSPGDGSPSAGSGVGAQTERHLAAPASHRAGAAKVVRPDLRRSSPFRGPLRPGRDDVIGRLNGLRSGLELVDQGNGQ